MASSDYTVSVTHPTNCSNGSIIINGPAGASITYSIGGGAESASTPVPATISNLSAGTHVLKVNFETEINADPGSFTVPITLSSGYYWYTSTFSSWFWFWIIAIVLILLIVAAITWSRWW